MYMFWIRENSIQSKYFSLSLLIPIQEAEYYFCVLLCLESSEKQQLLGSLIPAIFLPWQVLCVRTLLYPNPGMSSLEFSRSFNHFCHEVLCCISWLITVGLHGLSHALLLIAVSDRQKWGFNIFLLHRLFVFPVVESYFVMSMNF